MEVAYQTSESRILLIRVVLLGRVVRLEGRLAVAVDLHDTGQIATSVAVIWRGPDRDERVVKHVLVPLLDELVGSSDQFERVDVVELGSSAAHAHS